ncbi:MAG: hypothetical protein Ct9H300mP16_19850 [Pseudomonadota bacterium]|nr:MAG: hypothetical protein Ct9H300mP16_19850 [Pseudomonadota bacterium]
MNRIQQLQPDYYGVIAPLQVSTPQRCVTGAGCPPHSAVRRAYGI